MVVSVVTVINCYEPIGTSSVWVIPGVDNPLDPAIPNPDEHPNAILIVGPTGDGVTQSVAAALRVAFERLGHSVVLATWADD